MQIIKTLTIYSILSLFIFQYSYIYAAEEVATKAVTSSFEMILGKTIEDLSAISSYVKVALKAYRIGQEIRKYNFPTIEERVYAEEVAEKYAFLTAENELQKCFIDNRTSSVRNRFGQPVACEEIARVFSMLGGENEANKMTSIYNQYRDIKA